MDPNLLSFFSVPNNQTLNPVDQNAESSSSTHQQQPDPQSWRQSGLDNDMGLSDQTSAPSRATHGSYDNASTAASDISFTQAPMPSPYTQYKTVLPTRGHPRSHHQQRKKESHDRKRTKVDTESALESLDYWIQFDDEEAERVGSFEIDFSKRYDMTNQNRPAYATTSTTPGLGTGLYASAPAFKGADFLDDNALDNALSDDEEGFDSINLEEHLAKIETMPPPEVPPREGLYSTPLSWERPEPGLRMDQPFGVPESPGSMGMVGYQQAMPGVGSQVNQVLSNDEQRRLLAIAMNTGRTPASFMPPSGFGLGFGAGLGTGLPPEFNASIDSILGVGDHSQSQTPTPGDNSKTLGPDIKRETSSNDGGSSAALSSSVPPLHRTHTGMSDKGKDKLKAGDRTAHNDIERKYRTNLKDKIAELRDAVPALMSIPEDGEDDGESSNPQRAPKVSKGTVLTKATEYIQYLERRNKSILKEHQELARRLQAFEQLLSASARQPFLMPNHSRTLFDPRGFC
ncbi:helix-loop-helix DNA-binding domain-containing protein [Dactylonectria macrodidyma]|uniref:Helix-loop-helix DNA-binding domain-containing protein n=1 Tax=Dactylonectria macrodidyma TaxID=307937 RepID=A0A9P9FGV0_9HYPO|nr:helix-loop-helix DNA-binding domain-containing protein [Dactylonectria macrodidyma]